MKQELVFGLMSIFWLVLSGIGLATGSDPAFIVGLVSSVINSVGLGILVRVKSLIEREITIQVNILDEDE